MPHVALVTARAARDLDEDLPPLVAALGETHAHLSVVDWDDASTDWSNFDVVVLRLGTTRNGYRNFSAGRPAPQPKRRC